MADNMVRTQVYLPQATYDALVTRAQEQGLTMASQIRSALDEYLQRTQDDEDGAILQPDDPLFSMIGFFDSGLTDIGVNHDYYLYGMPKRIPSDEKRIREDKAPPLKTRSRRTARPKKRSR